MVKFKASVYKTGNSHAVVIPSDFIKHNVIDVTKEYFFEIKEVDDNGEKENC